MNDIEMKPVFKRNYQNAIRKIINEDSKDEKESTSVNTKNSTSSSSYMHRHVDNMKKMKKKADNNEYEVTNYDTDLF